MHEVRRENGACSHRTSQAGPRSAHIRVHKVQQRRPVHRGIRCIFAVVAGRQGQLGLLSSAPWSPRQYLQNRLIDPWHVGNNKEVGPRSRELQDPGLPDTVAAVAPAIEPTPNPATLKPGTANAMTAVTLPIDESYGLVIVLDERMLGCSFSFMKSSPASSRSICASIPAANSGSALPRGKSSPSMPMW
jgi:hypothetical protein